jgi:hypothetical protein
VGFGTGEDAKNGCCGIDLDSTVVDGSLYSNYVSIRTPRLTL